MPTEKNVSLLSAVAEESRGGPLARTYFAARIIAIGGALAGAIPTAMTFYHSWKHSVPFNQVSHRLAQADLWSKNFDCRIDYRTLTTANSTRIDVGACQRNGDISLKISTPNGQSTYEWIAFDNLQKPAKKTASLMDLFITAAHADDGKPQAGQSTAASSRMQVAQGAMQVVCTARVASTQIVRIVNEGGKCYRETFSPVAGKVEKREDVPCNTQCPPTKG